MQNLHKEKMARKKAVREIEYQANLDMRSKVAEIFAEEGVAEKLVTNAHRRVWKNMEMAFYLLSIGRPRKWVKRILGLNNLTMKRVYELNNTAQ